MFYSNTILAILFVFLWNSGFIGAEYGMKYAGPFTLLFWRYLALMLILLLYLILKKRLRWPGWTIAAPAFLVGILAHAIWLSCSLLSIQYAVPAGIVALIVALQPLATGALSGIVVGESTPWFRWIALLTGFCGVTLPVLVRIDYKSPASVFAYVIPLGAVVAMTMATLIQRKVEVDKPSFRLPFDLALFYQSLASALILIVPAILLEGMATQWRPRFLWTMAWLVLAVSLWAYVLMFELIKKTDATRVASLFYLGPPVTMLMAWALFGDTIRLMDVVGMVIVCVSIILVQLQTKDKPVRGRNPHAAVRKTN